MGQLYWMADNDPLKVDAFLNMPIWQYWTMLNNRLELYQKQKSENDKRRK